MPYTIIQGYDGSDQQSFEWTNETPTKEGWYWVIGKDGLSANEKNLEVLFFDGKYFTVAHAEYWYSVESFSRFLGPLPIPELPTK